METTIIGIAISLFVGGALGFVIAKSRGGGEKISQKLQEKINAQERTLQSVQSKAAAAKGELRLPRQRRMQKQKKLFPRPN